MARKPKLTPRRSTRILVALRRAQAAQTEYWEALGELESAVGFDFSMDNSDLENYSTPEDFIEAAWAVRDK
jgi:hypothetical protein